MIISTLNAVCGILLPAAHGRLLAKSRYGVIRLFDLNYPGSNQDVDRLYPAGPEGHWRTS